jgi:hypothetical protein
MRCTSILMQVLGDNGEVRAPLAQGVTGNPGNCGTQISGARQARASGSTASYLVAVGWRWAGEMRYDAKTRAIVESNK